MRCRRFKSPGPTHRPAWRPIHDCIFARADPQVWLHSDGNYDFTATLPEYDRIELRRARSLDGLGQAEAKVVWRKHASGAMSHHIWAPELQNATNICIAKMDTPTSISGPAVQLSTPEFGWERSSTRSTRRPPCWSKTARCF